VYLAKKQVPNNQCQVLAQHYATAITSWVEPGGHLVGS